MNLATHTTVRTRDLSWARPWNDVLTQFPAVCFTLTLLADIAYWQTTNLLWQDFSSWLLFAGLVFGALAIIVGLVDFFVRPWLRGLNANWPRLLGGLLVLALALVNALVHAGDGWTAVVPWGLALSAITVVLMIVVDWFSRSAAAGH